MRQANDYLGYARLLTDEERDAWRIPEELSVSEWASRYRSLPQKGTSEPGSWDNERTPFLCEIMDAWSDPSIRQITFVKCTQIGGTEVGLNFIGYIIGQAPGPTLYVLPGEDIAKNFSRKRIWPLITETPALSQYLPYNSDDLSRTFFGLTNMDLRLGWANSPASLSSDPNKYVILDEVNKYPRFSGREADPISLAKERQNTFKFDKKTYIASTPTVPDGAVSVEYAASDQREYHVPCPHCLKFQSLSWDRVKFRKEDGPAAIRASGAAHYECRFCFKAIEERQKASMLQQGVWCPKGCSVAEDGVIEGVVPITDHRGYRISALYSPWVTWAELAAEFLESKDHIEKLMNFINSKLAEPFEEKIESSSEDEIRHLISDYPENTVPKGAEVLLGAVDVQQDHFWVDVWAWGEKEQNWLITQRRLETWTEIEALLFATEFEGSGGRKLRLTAAAIDTGFRTDEVYKFCYKWMGQAYPVKGQENLQGLMYKPNKIDRLPNGTQLKGGIVLWHINKYHYQDKIQRFFRSSGSDSGRTHFYKDVPDAYLRQLCSEHKVQERDKKGRTRMVWKPRPGHRQNHFRDTRAYGMALADILKVWTLNLTPRPSRDAAPKPKGSGFIDAGDDFIGDQGRGWL